MIRSYLAAWVVNALSAASAGVRKPVGGAGTKNPLWIILIFLNEFLVPVKEVLFAFPLGEVVACVEVFDQAGAGRRPAGPLAGQPT